MLRFGKISEVDASRGMARVEFLDEELVSGWLHCGFEKTHLDKHQFSYDIDEHVACILENEGSSGVILCAIYSNADQPSSELSNEHRTGREFEDGSFYHYDRSNSKLTADLAGEVDCTAAGTIRVTVGSREIVLGSSILHLGNETGSQPVALGNDLNTNLDKIYQHLSTLLNALSIFATANAAATAGVPVIQVLNPAYTALLNAIAPELATVPADQALLSTHLSSKVKAV